MISCIKKEQDILENVLNTRVGWVLLGGSQSRKRTMGKYSIIFKKLRQFTKKEKKKVSVESHDIKLSRRDKAFTGSINCDL